MTVKISASFAKKDRELNGLDHIGDELLDKPYERRYAVITYEPKFAKKDFTEGGSEDVTIRVAHIEALVDEAAINQARALMDAAFEARTGRPAPDPTLFDGPSPDGALPADGVTLEDIAHGEDPAPWTPGSADTRPDEWMDEGQGSK